MSELKLYVWEGNFFIVTAVAESLEDAKKIFIENNVERDSWVNEEDIELIEPTIVNVPGYFISYT
jgi:hypothetical protein